VGLSIDHTEKSIAHRPNLTAAAHRLPPSEALERKHKPRKILSLARSLKLARGAEKHRERLDRINRIYRMFAQDAVAGVGKA